MYIFIYIYVYIYKTPIMAFCRQASYYMHAVGMHIYVVRIPCPPI